MAIHTVGCDDDRRRLRRRRRPPGGAHLLGRARRPGPRLRRRPHDLLLDDVSGHAFVDLGEHRLKDLTSPQRLFQLAIEDLPDRFPPLRTLDARPTNLPTQATALVGRDRELAEIVGAAPPSGRPLRDADRAGRHRQDPARAVRGRGARRRRDAMASSSSRSRPSPTRRWSSPRSPRRSVSSRPPARTSTPTLRPRSCSSSSTTWSRSSRPPRTWRDSWRRRRACACWPPVVRRCAWRPSASIPIPAARPA